LDYAYLFTQAVPVLESHRGYDVKIAPLFIRLEPLFDQSYYFRYSRLLIEPNASLADKNLFSPFTMQLGSRDKAKIISSYYIPYRRQLTRFLNDYRDQGIFHFSIHSFQPKLGNQDRSSWIGIRFNPAIKKERDLAVLLKRCLLDADPALSIRYNYPYKDTRNDLLNALRNEIGAQYIGLELNFRNDIVLSLRTTIYEAIANLRGILE
jgi:predicted N-formylglutamate amidohydrolase